MSYNYNNIKNTALNLIKKFGVDVTVSRIGSNEKWIKKFNTINLEYYWENVTTGEIVTSPPDETIIETPATVVITNYQTEEIDGTRIIHGDKRLLSTNVPVPKANDVYTIGTTKYRYVDHDTISPSNFDVLYIIQVRI